MKRRCYAGLGSRETPADILRTMEALGTRLAVLGWTLRSGAADGADVAFERGCDLKYGDKEIYLPWRGFNGHTSPLGEPTRAAFTLAREVHPAWDRLTEGGQKLHARNCHQVLGVSLQAPVEFVVCWTPRGEITGGTATAIRLAGKYAIPLFNLAKCDARDIGDVVRRTI